MAGQRARPGTVTRAVTGGFTRAEVVAILVVGVVGVLIPGLQPQLLGALATEGVLSPAAVGTVATAELLTMGIAAGAAGFVLPIAGLRWIAAAGILVTAALDVATGHVAASAVLPLRAAAGLAEGVLIWIAIGFITRTAQPARWSGLYLMIQTLAQLAMSALFGAVVLPARGSAGGFAWLGIATATALLALAWLPRRYAPLVASSDHVGGLPPVRGLIALLSVVGWMGFVVAVWVYVEPLATSRGVGPALLPLVAPLSLGMQVVGAGVAAWIGERWRALPTLLAIAVLEVVLLALMAAPPSSALFVAATAAFGFLWLFALPFQVPLVIAADPSRRAATLIGGAQLVGASLGPLLAALLVGDTRVGGVLAFGAGALAVATLLAMLSALGTRDGSKH